MKKIIVMLKLELPGYEDDEVTGLCAEVLGEMILQSDTVLHDLGIQSFRVEEE